MISQRAPGYLTLVPQHPGYEGKLQWSTVLIMGSGDWTPVFVLAKQALYRLSHLSRLFLSFQIYILVVKLGCWILCPRFLLTCSLSHRHCLFTLALLFYSDTGLQLFIIVPYIKIVWLLWIFYDINIFLGSLSFLLWCDCIFYLQIFLTTMLLNPSPITLQFISWLL